MSIPLEFQCTFEEFREGGQTINRSVNSAVRFEWVAWVCIALVTLLTISRKDSSKDGPKLVLFVPLALMTLFVIILLFSRRRQWRKNFQQNRDMQVPQRILISDDGLNFENAMSSGVIRWTGFVRLEETNRLFLLYTSPSLAVFIPKRAFATELDLRMFEAFARANVGSRSSGFEVLAPKAKA